MAQSAAARLLCSCHSIHTAQHHHACCYRSPSCLAREESPKNSGCSKLLETTASLKLARTPHKELNTTVPGSTKQTSLQRLIIDRSNKRTVRNRNTFLSQNQTEKRNLEQTAKPEMLSLQINQKKTRLHKCRQGKTHWRGAMIYLLPFASCDATRSSRSPKPAQQDSVFRSKTLKKILFGKFREDRGTQE
jgi:hypothetical protein